MPIEIVTVPCLADNYAFLLHASETGRTALIDAPEAGPIVEALEARNWDLSDIWITHHHDDHIDGVADLRAKYAPSVIGAVADAHRLPTLDRQVSPGETYDFHGITAHIIDVPGHTVGHIAFHVPDARAVFTADSLMALGCGRLFEGAAAQMWESMQKLRALPDETVVYSGHEYTETNARFALTIEPDNSDLISRAQGITANRQAGRPTVPSTLADEKATNPYLRVDTAELKSAIGMADASPDAVFAEVRARKDRF